MKREPLQILLIVCLSIIGVCFAQSTYYVTPTPDTPCPGSEEPCQTLSEYIADGTFNNLPKNTTIRFLPGNHTLNTTIALDNLTLLAVLGESSSLPGVTSRIVCTWPAGFAFTDITELHINALTFISCGHNNVGAINITSVEQSHISKCTFESNYAADKNGVGGAITAWCSSVRLAGNTFQNNSAYAGGAIYILYHKLHPSTNTFLGNPAKIAGGTIASRGETFNITTNVFQGNSAYQGRAVDAKDGIFTITNNAFLGNSAKDHGGAISATGGTHNITNNTFLDDSAERSGGAVEVEYGTFNIATNTFQNNSANRGGALNTYNSTLRLTTSTFLNNTAHITGGGLATEASDNLILTANTFVGNSAAYGGAIIAVDGTFHMMSNTFQKNSAYIGGAVHAISSAFTLTGNAFRKNSAFSSGGALAAYGCTFNLTTTPSEINACSAAEDVCVYDHQLTGVEKATTDSNTATYGGGMYVVNSTLRGNMILTENHATEGGGLFAYRAQLFFNDTIAIANNSATIGGGLLLSDNSKVYLPSATAISFINNTANQTGGAIHVKPVNQLELCVEELQLVAVYKYESDCFFQIELGNKKQYAPNNTKGLRNFIQSLNISIHFENNNANSAGVDLYGGLVDSCSLSSIKKNPDYYTFSYSGVVFDVITSSESTPNITSDPLGFCICSDRCSVHHYSSWVYPGGTVEVPVTALGQRNQTTIATIRVVDISKSMNLQLPDYSQSVGQGCNNLTYRVYSHAVGTTQKMTLYANGPCSFDNPVTVSIDIQQCPPGFQLLYSTSNCTCDHRLSQYTHTCVIGNETVLRPHNAEFWVGYSDDKGLILHPHCPFDYCTSEEMYLKVTHSDKQCNNNRGGLLCGRCSDHHSIAFSTFRCLRCSNSYLSLLAAFALAGIALVLFLLLLRLTVAAGTINGLIFYANVVTLNSAIFFRSGTSKVLTVFIAWLNLDLGIETCFYNGMDAYSKTWLQFVFPIYVWCLVVIMIVGSYYSGKMAKMFGRNPVAVLATLFLLSYTKLLRMAIAALSFTILEYPNSQIAVWLYDGNIGYLSRKHIPLFVVALVCLLFLYLPYTILLTVAQWLQSKSKRRVLSWINNRYLISFLNVYHAPYLMKRRYCIGAMLILRLVLSLVSAVNVLGDPKINLFAVLATLIFTTPILAGTGIYRSWYLSVLELSFLINLAILVSATFYVHQDEARQNTVTSASVSIAFATFIAIVIYHSIQQVKATQLWRKLFPRHEYVRVPLDDEDGGEGDPPDRVYAPGCAPTQSVVDIRELRRERMRREAERQETQEATVLRDPWEAREPHEPQNPIGLQEPL